MEPLDQQVELYMAMLRIEETLEKYDKKVETMHEETVNLKEYVRGNWRMTDMQGVRERCQHYA